jgi:hypothetical protein
MELCKGPEERGTMKVKRVAMTKAERAIKRAEKQEETIHRLRKFVEEPPSRLDQLLEKLGRPPTLERQMREAAKSFLLDYEKVLKALHAMKNNEPAA